jgi:predicted GTPase
MSIEQARRQLNRACNDCLAGVASDAIMMALGSAAEASVLVHAAGMSASGRPELGVAITAVQRAAEALKTAQVAVLDAANAIESYSASI